MAPTPEFTLYAGFQCYKNRKPILGTGRDSNSNNGWLEMYADSKAKRKKYCMETCLKHETCESITSNNGWTKCYIGGWGAERQVKNKIWNCYERNMYDVYSFQEHKSTSCMRNKSKKSFKKVMINAKKGIKPSEIRACQVECANDDECDGVSNIWNKCFLQYGRGQSLNKVAKNKHTCYEKTLSAVSKAQVCWQANNLGICDKAYGTSEQGPKQAECETDFAVNGFGFSGAETGSKFCKFLARTMQNEGQNFKTEVHPVSKMTSLANFCGELCPSRTTWTYVNKKCTAKFIGVADRKANFSFCLAKCAAHADCKGVTRRLNTCRYQTTAQTTKYVEGDGDWHCYQKN